MPRVVVSFFLSGLAACAILATAGPAAASLDTFVAVYDAQANGFRVGTVELELRRAGVEEYVYRQHSSTRGLGSLFGSNDLTETSRLRVSGERLEPLEYISRRKGGDEEENARFLFDWPARRIRSRGAGAPWDLALSEGVIDPLMVRLALMVDLARGDRRFEYAVPRQNRLKTYRFAVVGRERIAIGAKTYDTIKVERTDDEEDRTWLWHAPELGYLPVRILKDKRRGTDTEILLSRVQITPAPPKPKPKPGSESEPKPESSAARPSEVAPVRPPETLPESTVRPVPRSRETSTRVEPTRPSTAPEIVKRTAGEGGAARTGPKTDSAAYPSDSSETTGQDRATPESSVPAMSAGPPLQSEVAASPPVPPSVRRIVCPSPRRVAKNWHWIYERGEARCVGRIDFPWRTPRD